MAQKIKSVKQKLQSGIYSNPIPFGANGENVDMANGYTLEATLGTVDVANKGDIQSQLNKHTQDIATNKANIESNDADIVGLQSRCFTIETSVNANDTAIKANANAIANNTANIVSNDNDILALQNRASTNEANISKNTTAITNINITNTEIESRVAANEKSIKNHTTDITTLNTKIDEGIAELAKDIEDIGAANEGSNANIVTRLSKVETDVAGHTTSITKNTTDITELKPKVEKNINDIQDRLLESSASSFIKNVSYDQSTFVITFTAYNDEVTTVSLPLENIIKEGHFDSETDDLVLVLSTGKEIRIPASSLVTEYQGVTGTQIITSVNDNKITATLREDSIDESFLTRAFRQRLDSIEGASYTKAEIDEQMSSITEFQEVQSWE